VERSPQPTVNNFAAIKFATGYTGYKSNLGRIAPRRTRSSMAKPARLREHRSARRPRSQTSERTTPCEGPHASTTHGWPTMPRKAHMKNHAELPTSPVWIGRRSITTSTTWIGRARRRPGFGSRTAGRAGRNGGKDPGVSGPGLAIETCLGAAAEQLLQSGVTAYPVPPQAAKAYWQRQAPSGTKDDELDAWSLGDALRVDGVHSAFRVRSHLRHRPGIAQRQNLLESFFRYHVVSNEILFSPLYPSQAAGKGFLTDKSRRKTI